MTSTEVIKVWENFSGASTEFKINDDREIVETLADGVLENQRNHGLKYCPCRMTTGNYIEDLKLICPCNFLMQQRYKENGECWCGLFVKR